MKCKRTIHKECSFLKDFFRKFLYAKYTVRKSTKSYVKWCIMIIDWRSLLSVVTYLIYRQIQGAHIAWGISVSLLDTIVTYATDSDRAQNSLQNDVLWSYERYVFKMNTNNLLKQYIILMNYTEFILWISHIFHKSRKTCQLGPMLMYFIPSQHIIL